MAGPAAFRLRPIDGDRIGTTAFFRNRAFLETFGAEIAALAGAGGRVDIFVHACSIGAEVWSLAMHLTHAWPDLDFHIDATDISSGFVQFARNGLYPRQIVDHLAPAEQACFDLSADGRASVKDAIRARVDFLEPASFVDFEPGRRYDVVSLLNALVYVPAASQATAVARIAGYNDGLLALTGGHHATVADDLARNGYQPIMAGFEAIHAGWTDRQRPPAWRPDMQLPPNIFTDPYLGPIDDAPGWRYRHGALFRKQAAAAAA